MFRQTKLLGSYWKMLSWDSNKERVNITIHQAYSVSFTINMCIYGSQGSRSKFRTKCYWFWSAKAKIIWLGQIYTVLSRETTDANLYCIGKFKKSVIKVNKVALLEYERLKQSNLFSTIRNFISGDTLTGFVSNVRSFPRHLVI